MFCQSLSIHHLYAHTVFFFHFQKFYLPVWTFASLDKMASGSSVLMSMASFLKNLQVNNTLGCEKRVFNNPLNDLVIFSYPELKLEYILNAHPANCICIEFDKRGRYFATGSADAVMSLWDVRELVCVRTFSRWVLLLLRMFCFSQLTYQLFNMPQLN